MQLNIATTWLPTYKQVTVFKFLTDSTTEFLAASVLSEVVKVRAEGLWIPFTYIDVRLTSTPFLIYQLSQFKR